eukprot:scaffold15633_cov107-Isochrysis_galbana.AAC.14
MGAGAPAPVCRGAESGAGRYRGGDVGAAADESLQQVAARADHSAAQHLRQGGRGWGRRVGNCGLQVGRGRRGLNGVTTGRIAKGEWATGEGVRSLWANGRTGVCVGGESALASGGAAASIATATARRSGESAPTSWPRLSACASSDACDSIGFCSSASNATATGPVPSAGRAAWRLSMEVSWASRRGMEARSAASTSGAESYVRMSTIYVASRPAESKPALNGASSGGEGPAPPPPPPASARLKEAATRATDDNTAPATSASSPQLPASARRLASAADSAYGRGDPAGSSAPPPVSTIEP